MTDPIETIRILVDDVNAAMTAENDEWRDPVTGNVVLIDLVRDGLVYMRLTDGNGGLIDARKMVIDTWEGLVKKHKLERLATAHGEERGNGDG